MFDVLGVKNIERGCVFQIVTPCYIDMELKTGGLEDDFQFQLGDFLGSIAIFRGATFFSDPFFFFRSLFLLLAPRSISMDQYGPTSLTCFVSGLHPVSLEEFGGCQNDGSQLDK